MSFKIIFILLSGIALVCRSSAQTLPDRLLDHILAGMSEDLPEELDFDEFAEKLAFYLDHPIDINRTNGDELRELMFLSQVQVSAIIAHRAETGDYVDVHELQSVDGLSLEKVRLLLPFVTLRREVFGKMSLGRLASGRLNQELFIRYGRVLEKQEGYNTTGASAYAGSPGKVTIKYRATIGGRAAASFVVEKNAGERFSTLGYGEVLQSLNLNWSGKGLVERIVAGSYTLQFGQGIAMWSGIAMGKGSSVLVYPRWGPGLRAVSSGSPVMTLRGGGAVIRAGAITVTPFFSSVRKDATLDPATHEVTSISEAGLYRTENEVLKRRMLHETVAGSAISYSSGRLSAGMIMFRTGFDHPIASGREPYDQFGFAGRTLLDGSLFYNYTLGGTTFFGEHAASSKLQHAGTVGLITGLAPPLALVMAYRYRSAKYGSFFSQAASESASGGETGFYAGMSLTPSRSLSLDVYADNFRFPWLRYRVSAPSFGKELYGTLVTSWRFFNLKTLCRYKQKEENSADESTITFVEPYSKTNIRIDLSTRVSSQISIGSRLESVTWQKGKTPKEHGLLFYHEIVYEPKASRVTGSARFCVFDTQSYNSRVYAYEDDVLYAYTNPAFQDTGSRFYANTKLRLTRNMSVWARYARTVYLNKTEIGSAGETIIGPVRSDVKLLVKVAL